MNDEAESEVEKETSLYLRVTRAIEALVEEHYGMAPRSYALLLDLDDPRHHLVPFKVDCIRDALMLIRSLRSCADRLESTIEEAEQQHGVELLRKYTRNWRGVT